MEEQKICLTVSILPQIFWFYISLQGETADVVSKESMPLHCIEIRDQLTALAEVSRISSIWPFERRWETTRHILLVLYSKKQLLEKAVKIHLKDFANLAKHFSFLFLFQKDPQKLILPWKEKHFSVKLANSHLGQIPDISTLQGW